VIQQGSLRRLPSLPQGSPTPLRSGGRSREECYWNDVTGEAMGETFSVRSDPLLGRKRYDIFTAHWPYVQMDAKASDFDALNVEIARRFNASTKYVATHRSAITAGQR
jgi:hypothetical protein